ncbi:hypothetical protein QR66_12925 [Chromobacterium piscinae]|nr:hypothetical protein QR66_12925 [Chromobacterium piscinae]
MKRDIYQRRAYALHRMSLAVDRVIRATDPAEKERLKHWVQAWAIRGGMRKEVTDLHAAMKGR